MFWPQARLVQSVLLKYFFFLLFAVVLVTTIAPDAVSVPAGKRIYEPASRFDFLLGQPWWAVTWQYLVTKSRLQDDAADDASYVGRWTFQNGC